MTGAERPPRPEGAWPRVESLKVRNFRALRAVDIDDLTPLTVFLGPNGSGKSTLLDVFGFLSDCFRFGLRPALDLRGQGKDVRSRGQDSPVVIELGYKESAGGPRMKYHLSIDADDVHPRVTREWLGWHEPDALDRVSKVLDFTNGSGVAVHWINPRPPGLSQKLALTSPDLLAVNALGMFESYPEIVILRTFIMDWYVAELSALALRNPWYGQEQERISRTGDNIAEVVRALREHAPQRLTELSEALRRRVPLVETIGAERMLDGRTVLTVKDRPFSDPISSLHISEGTLKLLAYLILLRDPSPPALIGIEEPENFLHPRILYGLGEEFRAASARAQILMTTHSPFLLNALRDNEVRLLARDASGFTRVIRASDVRGVREFIEEGAQLGELWMEGRFGVGDPVTDALATGTTGRT